MKEIIRRLKMRKAASQKKTLSVDPIKAYKGRIEIGIYAWLLDLIAKELEAEQTAISSEQTVTSTQTVTSVTSAAGVQTA